MRAMRSLVYFFKFDNKIFIVSCFFDGQGKQAGFYCVLKKNVLGVNIT